MSFWPMLKKELKELVRSYKLLMVPLGFVILGLMQPLTYKLLPMLENVSNLPAGSVLKIAMPPADWIVGSTIGQYNQMGVLFLVLVAMGTIAGERATGVAATVLTKPVGRGNYVAAKAVAYTLLAALSLLLGLVATAYYTHFLIAPVTWLTVLKGGLLYLPNLLLVVAVTLLCSSVMSSGVAAGGTALVAVILLNTVPGFLGKSISSFSPGKLTAAANGLFQGQNLAIARPLTGVLALVVLILLGSWFALEREEI
ncbi:MAG: ABC transporter permease subunit [Mycobacterium leprae]